MSFRLLCCVVLVCFTFGISASNFVEKQQCQHERLGLAEALESAERSTSYFEKRYKGMNLDGIFGLRASEGFLYNILSNVDRNSLDYSSLRLYYKLQELHRAQKSIAESAQEYLKRSNPSYYNQLGLIVKTKFFIQFPYRRADLSLTFKDTIVSSVLNETFSDHCMAELMGSDVSGPIAKKCVVSKQCLKYMGNATGKGYVSTHQGLYLILGTFAGCKEELSKAFGSEEKLEYRLNVLGSNIYAQALYNSKNIDMNKDLFLEQILVCYILGVVDCMRLDWLEMGIGWQDVTGAYLMESWKTTSWLDHKLGQRRIDFTRKKRSLDTRQSRSLMEDVMLQGGGSAHTSGIGMAFASLHIRWIISPPDYEALGMKSPLPVTHCPLGSTHRRP